MIIDDGREATAAAALALGAQKLRFALPHMEVLPADVFLSKAGEAPLTPVEKQIVVDQATLLIDRFYAHLPFKRARYAADPVQQLRLAGVRIVTDPAQAELAFHKAILESLTSVRDAHTFYGLPTPFKGAIAFLPFRMDWYKDETGKRRFIVTSVTQGFNHPRFGLHAEITSWNGIPIEKAVEREGQSDPGANPAALFARGMNRMSCRSLTFSLPPDEEWVVLQYIPKGADPKDQFGILLPWNIATNCAWTVSSAGSTTSIADPMAESMHAARMFWNPDEYARHSAAPPLNPVPVDRDLISTIPRLLEFQHSGGVEHLGALNPVKLRDAAHPERIFGYLRIVSFDVDDSTPNACDAFVAEVKRILEKMQAVAPDGLIVDVRSNPGGNIQAAERVLQLLAPSPIQPAGFHFIATQTTQQIATSVQKAIAAGTPHPAQDEWQPWIADLLASVSQGGVITGAQPLTGADAANNIGQCYQGPVALLIDSLSYSATDMFAGGFQDSMAGPVIGVDENTGGGGANRWLHAELAGKLADAGITGIPLEPLPRETQMGFAIRRSSRVGRNQGSVIEDVGVKADIVHRRTLNDLLDPDVDLMAFTCATLGAMPRYALQISRADLTPAGIAVSVKSANLHRIECSVNTMPQCSFPGESLSFMVPVGGLIDGDPVGSLQVNGFAMVHNEDLDEDECRLVVSARAQVKQSAVTTASAP